MDVVLIDISLVTNVEHLALTDHLQVFFWRNVYSSLLLILKLSCLSIVEF